MIIEPVTVEGEFITVSLIVWRRFKRAMPSLVEQILDLNPGLGALGPFLPVGTTFEIPVPTPREPAMLEPVKLW
jgi:phage tail protein X